jgi:ribose-phosphate pyrophosphokinase
MLNIIYNKKGEIMIIVGGSASKSISTKLAKALDVELAELNVKRFTDKECYIRLMGDFADEEVVVVQNTYPDENIIELFLLQDVLKEAGVKKLVTVIPYYGYARQDKIFNKGECISAKAIAKHIELQTDETLTVDLHAKSILNWFDKPVHEITGMTPIGEHLKQNPPDIIMAPDKGAVDRAKLVSEVVGCDWDYFEKTRIDDHNVKIAPKTLDVSGKDIVIVDDIIATGGTIITSGSYLKDQGASSVVAACTHGLYTENALERLKNSVLDDIISTDTLESETSTVSVANEIAKFFKNNINGIS